MEFLYKPDHPNASKNGTIKESRFKAAEALGKPLPKKAVVHHASTGGLVICQNQEHHMLLHQRERALKACGNANYRPCRYCGQYDDLSKMNRASASGGNNDNFHHEQCRKDYMDEYHQTHVRKRDQ